jgi:transcriptional regulator with XRE-family HTH domain
MSTKKSNKRRKSMTTKEFRDKYGLTQEDLANKLGVTKNYLWMVESNKRSMSKLLREKFDHLIEEYASADTVVTQSNIHGDAVNVIGNTHSHVQITPTTPPPTPAQPPSEDLAVVPTETLTEHIEVVQQNNELLQEVRETQEKELRLKREQGRQLSEVLEFVQGLDEMMQKRVREIIDERTRTIIAATNHHIHTQAQVMITAIEGIINMVEAGVTNPDLFLRQLRAVRSQLEKMADFKQ